ncbi:MAG: hypothetical protein ACKVOM_13730 [Ferruginibacter sp.]
MNVKNWITQHYKKLVFAMNGGMDKPHNSPQGLYIENKKLIAPLDTTSGNGIFFKP